MDLGILDLSLLVAYFAGMVLVGWLVGRRTTGAKDYFLGSRDLPCWALLLSIVATETSTVTFLSVPGSAWAGDCTFLQLPMGYVLGRVLVVWLLLPHYFRGEMVSAYQVLRHRFGGRLQKVASLTFLIARTIGGGLRLFLTALVVERLTGMSVPASVAAITAVTLVYTWLGGMRAVVWTDVAQFVIYLTGAIAAFCVLLQRLPEGLDTVLASAAADAKTRVFDFSFDLSRTYTLWSGLVGGAFISLGSHGVDQLIVQRLLSARSRREAGTALLLSGVVVLLQIAFFLMLGLGLFAYYKLFPPAQPFEKPDTVFRDFLLTQMPTGLLGLVLGAVFAAAMSSFSSSLNSSAAAFVGDFLLPITRRDPASPFVLRSARAATAVFAVLEALVAVNCVDDRAIVDQVLAVAAFTTGVLLGVFFLGTLTARVGAGAALCGFVAGLAVDLFCKFWWPSLGGPEIAYPGYAVLGCVTTFVVGLLAAGTIRPRPAAATQ